MKIAEEAICIDKCHFLSKEMESPWKSCCVAVFRAMSGIRDHVRIKAV
jgi:hypothetical protein